MSTELDTIKNVLNTLVSYKQMDKKKALNDLYVICSHGTIHPEVFRIILLNRIKLLEFLEGMQNMRWVHEEENISVQLDFIIDQIKGL